MSVAWAYVIANEVLSLLVSAGTILSVDSAALGVTVLAWGNSISDLIANVAVASRGGGGGAQVAVSGCYGGPVFNVLVGLGLSMLLSCWSGYPRPVEIPRDPGLYRTLAFVVVGLLWAVVMLPRRGMRVDRTLGIGLLVIYFCFLCINISQLKNAR
jgi:sodium/potassium/calcium exchanger 6